MEVAYELVAKMAEDIAELKGMLSEVRTLLVTLMGTMATNPVDLIREMGEALVRAQGYDRPQPQITGQPEDLFVNPSDALQFEPENEAIERDAHMEALNARAGWSDLGIEPPVGEFDVGPDGE